MTTIDIRDPIAVAVVQAIHQGDTTALRQLLTDNPSLATTKLGTDRPGGMARSLLHVATDWPGHHPNNVETVRNLIDGGTDVQATFVGSHTETPLHWAASSDDVDVLDALLDAGADIEAGGGVIGNGTPLADAAGFGQWNAARRLIERGAHANLWQAAALGLMDRVHAYFDADEQPPANDITDALWRACHGGQQAAAEYLLGKGGDINWIGFDKLTPLDAANRSGAHDLAEWLTKKGALTASRVKNT
jgi:ankyrin repeat protein